MKGRFDCCDLGFGFCCIFTGFISLWGVLLKAFNFLFLGVKSGFVKIWDLFFESLPLGFLFFGDLFSIYGD